MNDVDCIIKCDIYLQKIHLQSKNTHAVSFLARLSWRKPKVLLQFWHHLSRRRCRAKTVTFCNISVITEDIYLKLRVWVHFPVNNPYYQWRQFKKKKNIGIMPLFRITHFILYQAPHSQVLAPACGHGAVFCYKKSMVHKKKYVLLHGYSF